MALAAVGILLIIIGLLVTVFFWSPRLVNRLRLRDLLGSWYPVVYVIYLANGPFLMLLGLLLVILFKP